MRPEQKCGILIFSMLACVFLAKEFSMMAGTAKQGSIYIPEQEEVKPLNRTERLLNATKAWDYFTFDTSELPLAKERFETFVGDLYSLHRGQECSASFLPDSDWVHIVCDSLFVKNLRVIRSELLLAAAEKIVGYQKV